MPIAAFTSPQMRIEQQQQQEQLGPLYDLDVSNLGNRYAFNDASYQQARSFLNQHPQGGDYLLQRTPEGPWTAVRRGERGVGGQGNFNMQGNALFQQLFGQQSAPPVIPLMQLLGLGNTLIPQQPDYDTMLFDLLTLLGLGGQ